MYMYLILLNTICFISIRNCVMCCVHRERCTFVICTDVGRSAWLATSYELAGSEF